MIMSAGLCSNGVIPPTINLTVTGGNYFNVYDQAVSAGWNGVTPKQIVVSLSRGIVLGSSYTNSPAMKVDTRIPLNSSVIIINDGLISGKGGEGGGLSSSTSYGVNGENVGPSLWAERPCVVENLYQLFGGGGGAGSGRNYVYYGKTLQGGAGGGGAGTDVGLGGDSGNYFGGASGTRYYGGAGAQGEYFAGARGYSGGLGGSLGGVGGSANGSTGGLPGYYIVGNQYVVWGHIGLRGGRVA